ncbi:MFS transporter [Streptomyces monashensis]|uniref:MFS transporter n=1 Tax=Streptomyces monashensis TaxID=1678012 RepID=UPI0033D97C79
MDDARDGTTGSPRTTDPLVRSPRTAETLVRYLLTASLVRTASGGAAVGLFTLTVRTGGSGGAALGGLLAALLTAPYVVGPWLAGVLDRARDGRRVLAVSFVVFGGALAAAALLLGRVPFLVVAGLVTVAGLCGPLVTGGLSSRLAAVDGWDERGRRRAEGWDSATYGIGNTFGPAAVGAVGAVLGARTGVLCLGAAAAAAAFTVLTLPAGTPPAKGQAGPLRVRQTFRIIVTVGQLRRVMLAMALTALVAGGITVVATTLGRQLTGSPEAGAALAAVYGLGYLAGSVVAGIVPLRGEPERTSTVLVVVSAAAVACCAVAPGYAVAVVTFAATGAASALLFTATLAVRAVYAPPEARAQVYVSMGALKMAVSSAGTALAGSLMSLGPRTLLGAGCAVTLFALAGVLCDRIRSGRKNSVTASQRNSSARNNSRTLPSEIS